MLSKGHFERASWTLLDQGVVSVGAFAVNVTLARYLPGSEYGTYALLLGALLLLQLVTGSLLFYPLSVRRSVAVDEASGTLLRTTFVLTLLFCIPLSLGVGAGLSLFGRTDLVAGVACYFTAWQLQEMARRSLLAEFAHKKALVGDFVAYIGQALVLVVLGTAGGLTLPKAFGFMAAVFSVGAAIQIVQARILRPGRLALGATIRDYLSLGGWSLANGGLLALRYHLLSWTLALLNGPIAAGQLQAANNVVGLANPIVLGLCNIIPQAAARAHQHGKEQAWHAARPYALIGAPPILSIYAVLFLAPGIILSVVYGPASPYVALTTIVPVLAFGSALSYGTDMICSYLHGVDLARTALLVNVAGLLVSALLAFPLAAEFGLSGVCFALVAANLVRLLLSYAFLLRILAHDRLRLA